MKARTAEITEACWESGERWRVTLVGARVSGASRAEFGHEVKSKSYNSKTGPTKTSLSLLLFLSGRRFYILSLRFSTFHLLFSLKKKSKIQNQNFQVKHFHLLLSSLFVMKNILAHLAFSMLNVWLCFSNSGWVVSEETAAVLGV